MKKIQLLIVVFTALFTFHLKADEAEQSPSQYLKVNAIYDQGKLIELDDYSIWKLKVVSNIGNLIGSSAWAEEKRGLQMV